MDAPQPVTRYRFSDGGGLEELDRFAVRDRIRSGEIARTTELAIVGTDEWKAADTFPELVRYFDMAGVRPATGGYVPAAKQRVVESMGDRVVKGMMYPIAGGAVVTLIATAVVSVFPFFGFVAAIAATFIMLNVIRQSADGKTKMSAMIDTSDLGALLVGWLRVLAVTLIALAPLIFVTWFSFGRVLRHTMSGGTMLLLVSAAAAFGIIYYPACLATVAVWDNVLAALSPAYVFRVIRTMGGDYFIVIAMWFVASFVTGFIRVTSPLAFIPIVGGVFSSFLQYYVMFYAGHLLGYAAYRHAPELGWE